MSSGNAKKKAMLSSSDSTDSLTGDLASSSPASASGAHRKDGTLREILPKNGLVYPERSGMAEALSKPKIMPIKSLSLLKLQQMEQAAAEQLDQQRKEQQ